MRYICNEELRIIKNTENKSNELTEALCELKLWEDNCNTLNRYLDTHNPDGSKR